MFVGCSGGATRSPVPADQDYRQGGQIRITPQSLCRVTQTGVVCDNPNNGPCGVYSETVQDTPYAASTRTTLGVNEQVNMSTDYGYLWNVVGDGTISSRVDSNPIFTAGQTPGTATVIVSGGRTCTPQSIIFTMVAPTVGYYFNGLRRHQQGYADIGIDSNMYAAPTFVNFYNTYAQEAMANLSGSGVWACVDGQPHESAPHPTPISPAVFVQGSQLEATDGSYSGWCPVNPYQVGSETTVIPIQYGASASGPWNAANTVTSASSATAAGALSRTKDQASWNVNVGDPTVWQF